jgi:hypothetical protein
MMAAPAGGDRVTRLTAGLGSGTNYPPMRCGSHPSKEDDMPERNTVERAREDAREGKAPSTQAGEFVREEIHHVREGKHGARSPEQAIAIGLSKARKAGVKLPKPGKGRGRSTSRQGAARTKARKKRPSAKRSRAISRALKREGRSAASRKALSRKASSSARKRGPSQRSAAAKKAVRTKGPAKRSAAAKKAARSRKARS